MKDDITEGGRVTQVGEGPRAAGSPARSQDELSVGDTLAERYRLEQHINNDSAGRQVWRGVDVVLRRPVALVLRRPGGETAQEMLAAAVTASRVVHPNLIGVYDAIDEDTRAFVVREWIEGVALRDLVLEEGPLDAERTCSTMHAVAAAVASLHASGMPHGNVHPGTVMIAGEGRIVLSDSRVDTHTSTEADVRAIGAIGYFMLTGHWPRLEAGRSVLPDALRDSNGALVAPRQVRAGVPSYLDELVMDLLNKELASPTAHVLSTELGRLDTGEQLLLGGAGTLRFADETPEEPARSGTPKLIGIGVVAVALIAAGMVLGVKALNSGTGSPEALPSGVVSAGPTETATGAPSAPHTLALRADQVRIVDPPNGDRQEVKNAEFAVDSNLATAWKTQGYTRSNFGNVKPGMGILIKLDSPQRISNVKVQLTAKGASAELRAGTVDPATGSAGDATIVASYTSISEQLKEHPGTTMVFSTDGATDYQYLLFWITDLPADGAGKYRIGVQEISVQVP